MNSEVYDCEYCSSVDNFLTNEVFRHELLFIVYLITEHDKDSIKILYLLLNCITTYRVLKSFYILL